MARRQFLQWLLRGAAGASVAVTFDVERLLWVPGQKTVFLPPPPVVSLAHLDDILKAVYLPAIRDLLHAPSPLFRIFFNATTG